MTNVDVKHDEATIVDPEVGRLAEELGLPNESSMLYGKCSAWVRWQDGHQLPTREILEFARATSERQKGVAIKDRGFRVFDVRNDVAGEKNRLTARSAFYDFTVGNRGGRGGKLLFYELGGLSREGDLDLAVIDSFSQDKDHLLVGWKPHPLIGGGARGNFTTYLSCLVPNRATDILISSIKEHPDYPYKIAEALYPHGFRPTATPDEIRSALQEGSLGLSGAEIDAKVVEISGLTYMKRQGPQKQLWFADLRGASDWSHDTVNSLGSIKKLKGS